MAGNAGTPYQPISLQQHLGNRKSHRARFVYSGTTFVGQAVTEETVYNNVWYRFPWEFTQSALRGWESQNIYERYLFWRAHEIKITFKNPICIQDQVTADGQVTSGQNLHAQLFGYEDNLYQTGVADL